MNTNEITVSLTTLFAELVDGANKPGDPFMLNSGDAGLLRSLDKLSATEASDSVHGGATIAAHARHLQYDLSLMNRWAREGGNPYADAKRKRPGGLQACATTTGARFAARFARTRANGSTHWVRRVRPPRSTSAG